MRRATPASLRPDDKGEAWAQRRGERRPRGRRGRHWVLWPQARGLLRPPEAARGRKEPPRDLLEGAWPCSTPSLDFRSPDQGGGSPVFSHSLGHWL